MKASLFWFITFLIPCEVYISSMLSSAVWPFDTLWTCNLLSLRPPPCTVCVNVFMSAMHRHICVYVLLQCCMCVWEIFRLSVLQWAVSSDPHIRASCCWPDIKQQQHNKHNGNHNKTCLHVVISGACWLGRSGWIFQAQVWQLSCASSQGGWDVYQAVLMRFGYTHLLQWFVFPKTVI